MGTIINDICDKMVFIINNAYQWSGNMKIKSARVVCDIIPYSIQGDFCGW